MLSNRDLQFAHFWLMLSNRGPQHLIIEQEQLVHNQRMNLELRT